MKTRKITYNFGTDYYGDDRTWTATCSVNDKTVIIDKVKTCNGWTYDVDELPHGMIESIKESARELYDEGEYNA